MDQSCIFILHSKKKREFVQYFTEDAAGRNAGYPQVHCAAVYPHSVRRVMVHSVTACKLPF